MSTQDDNFVPMDKQSKEDANPQQNMTLKSNRTEEENQNDDSFEKLTNEAAVSKKAVRELNGVDDKPGHTNSCAQNQ